MVLFLLAGNSGFAQVTERQDSPQTTDTNVAPPSFKSVDEIIFAQTEVDQKATYPGGIEKFYKFVGKNLNLQKLEDFTGKILISFAIEKDGSLTDIKAVQSQNLQAAEAAITMMNKSPKWIPARVNGKAVKSMYSLPISLELKP